MNPLTLIAFGITGDLMRQKIIPALFALHKNNVIPHKSRIIGVSRRAWGVEEGKEYIRKTVLSNSPGASVEALDAFVQLFTIIQGDAQNIETYYALRAASAAHEKEVEIPPNRLIYMAIEPELYLPAVTHLAESGLLAKTTQNSWTRIVLEKPFGLDLISAQALQEALHSAFSEEEIYRVDHYLAKQSVEIIPPVDFSEVTEIAIRIMETADVSARGAFYDRVGALRDTIQNHALEMLACTLLSNEPRAQMIASRKARARVLELIPSLTQPEIATQTTRAQYRGYKEIAGVAAHSTTETYAAIRFTLPAPWRGIRVLLESGKKMPLVQKEIVISFKNRESVRVSLAGDSHEYEVLIRDSIEGNQSRFVSQEEVSALWRFIDPIVRTWQTGAPPLG